MESVVYKATWNGKSATMVRPHSMAEKVEVEPGGSLDVEQHVANRLRREDGWEVSNDVQVKDIKWGESKEDAQSRGEVALTDEQKAEKAKKERTAAIKKLKTPELDAYIVAHPSIPQDLKNNDEKKAAIVGFEFEGLYPAAPAGDTGGAQ